MNSCLSTRVGRAARRVHPDRAAGGDRDHRRPDRPAPARGAGGPRGGPPRPVRQQPEADRPGPAQLPRRHGSFPPAICPGIPGMAVDEHDPPGEGWPSRYRANAVYNAMNLLLWPTSGRPGATATGYTAWYRSPAGFARPTAHRESGYPPPARILRARQHPEAAIPHGSRRSTRSPGSLPSFPSRTMRAASATTTAAVRCCPAASPGRPPRNGGPCPSRSGPRRLEWLLGHLAENGSLQASSRTAGRSR